jgi:hypothetical protein
MSYTIETQKRVFLLQTPAGDQRFYPGTESRPLCIYAHEACCNNIHPRRPKWSVLAVEVYHEWPRMWDGQHMLPSVLWGAAGDADGGCIKPNNRDTTGTAYIKQWKDACLNPDRCPTPPRWTATIWAQDKDDTWPFPPLSLADAWDLPPSGYGKYAQLYGEKLRAALHSLFPTRPREGQSSEFCSVYDGDKYWDAMYLFMHRKSLPVSFYLSQ